MQNDYQIPAKFINSNFARPPSLTLEAIWAAEAGAKGLCLTGKPGTGKTMGLCLLVRDWLRARATKGSGTYWGKETKESWLFVSFPALIMRVQDSFADRKGEESAYKILKYIADMPYLIIDDLGAEKPTEYVRQATYFIINHREMNLLPTFITTNFSLDYLDKNIDPRISSRICGMCEVLRFDGADRRILK